jgi:immunoglobulin-binding protein 1
MQLLRHRADMLENATTEPSHSARPPIDEDGPGITVTRINKIGDQLVTTREQVKASVFKPRMEAPSISLEEYGDMVKAEAIARQNQTKEEEHVVRRYKQLVEAGLEDDEKLADEATMADRDWDAFKEANPRGWGNKANKRY